MYEADSCGSGDGVIMFHRFPALLNGKAVLWAIERRGLRVKDGRLSVGNEMGLGQ